MLSDSNADQRNAAAATTQDVLSHHLSCVAQGDLSGMMADYAPDSKFFTPNGVLRGSTAIREVCARLFEEFAKPERSFEILQQEVDGDTAYIVWKAETADNRFELATDTFIVQNGKIVTQTFAGKIFPKRLPPQPDAHRASMVRTAARNNMGGTHNTAQTRFVEVDSVRYAYRRFGTETGTPVVFLQHFRGGLDHWDPKVTDGIAKDRPVILLNNAGVASSRGEPADTVAGMADHVVAFLKALGLEEVDLLGFSLGGFIAQQLALESPDVIRRVILAGTRPQGGEGMDQFTPKVTEHATREEPTLEDYLYLFFSPSEASQAAGRAFWERRHTRSDQDVPSSVAAMGAQGSAIAAWGVVPHIHRYASLRRINQPVLVVNGANDIMVPTINSFILQQHIPNATLIIYPDSGHGAIFQYPELFVSHACLFLDGKGDNSASE